MAEVRSRADGVRIVYDDVGQGEPALLLLPSWCTPRSVFQPLIRGLQEKHRLLVMDLRGHGDSGSAGDFDNEALVEDALSVVEASGASQVVAVSLSHTGWVAIELRRRLGERVAKLVLLDWLIMDPPRLFVAALRGLQTDQWLETRDMLFGMWTENEASEAVTRFVREDMGSFPREMWHRGGREIERAYGTYGSPLRALAMLFPPVPTLHLYAQPQDPAYRLGQQSFANCHPWFQVVKLNARSHFPSFEVPDEVVSNIERFVSGQSTRDAFQPTQPPA